MWKLQVGAAVSLSARLPPLAISMLKIFFTYPDYFMFTNSLIGDTIRFTLCAHKKKMQPCSALSFAHFRGLDRRKGIGVQRRKQENVSGKIKLWGFTACYHHPWIQRECANNSIFKGLSGIVIILWCIMLVIQFKALNKMLCLHWLTGPLSKLQVLLLLYPILKLC